MSAVKLRKILSLSFSLVIVLLFPLTIYASTATPSEARPSGAYPDFAESLDEDILIASPSNATSMDDFMELDDFDTLDVPMFMSSGDDVTNTVDITKCFLEIDYYDMSGVRHRVTKYFNSDGYASLAKPSDYVSTNYVAFYVTSGALPSAGKYNASLSFSSATGGFTYTSCSLGSRKYLNNASSQGASSSAIPFTQSSGDIYVNTSVDLNSSLNYLSFVFYTKTMIPPYGGYLAVQFDKLSSSASTNVGTAGGSYTSDDATQDIANNSAQQVEQGDTIIELIKNTIQTISSQLTAFWNQLAGEFTNLYNKMSQQHTEQLESDRTNTDDIIAAEDANTNKVTTAIESHGNFIIEGLKKLFIPSDEYFKAYFDDLYSWFSERFGFLSFPIDLLLEVIDIFVNSSQTDCVLVLPSFTIMENLLWPEMSFNLTVFLNTNFSFVVVAIKTVTSIYLVMAFVQLCEEKWNEVMMN